MARINEFFKRESFHPRLTEYQVYKKKGIWFIAPLFIIFVALLMGTIYQFSPAFPGFANVSVDFTGGTVLTVTMDGPDMISGANFDYHLAMIENVLMREDIGVVGMTDPRTSGTNAIVVRYANVVTRNGVVENWNTGERTEEMIALNNVIRQEIEAAFRERHGAAVSYIGVDTESLDATAGSRAIGEAALAVSIAIAIALIYIIVRFNLFSGLATIAGILHDVLIMLALTVIFRIPIGTSLIAGVITIIAYTTNNSIILFDKVRDAIKPFKNKKHKIDVRQTVDQAITQTFTRQLFAFLTTFIPITVLSFVGIPALQEFALPIIFGLIAGFYSTMFVAPTLWGLMMETEQKRLAKNQNYITASEDEPKAKAKHKNKKATA